MFDDIDFFYFAIPILIVFAVGVFVGAVLW